LNAVDFAQLYEIFGHESLRLESEDDLYNFISKGIETKGEMFGLLEFVRLEYCSTDVINDFFDLLCEHFYGINASMWGSLRARLVLPRTEKKQMTQFPAFRTEMMKGWLGKMEPVQVPAMKKRGRFEWPDGIIAYLTRACGGNVHDRHVVVVGSGSFEEETYFAVSHPRSIADLETPSSFRSSFCDREEGIPHTMNNWVCYDFKEKRIVPTHYAIRTNEYGADHWHLRTWLVETSVDGERWQVVAREKDNEQLNGKFKTITFPVAGAGECRFIRLVNIGRNHFGNDCLWISAWEIFGTLIL
jgi:hypothetical protein